MKILRLILIGVAAFHVTAAQNAIHPVPTVVADKVNEGGDSGIKDRHVFVFLDEKSFSIQNLTDLFLKYRDNYCEPYVLRVTVYSDHKMLERLIKFENEPRTVRFSDDKKGLEAAAAFYNSTYPALVGYFRAEYHRYGGYDLFDYSMEKDSPNLTRVDLSKGVSHKGHLVDKVNKCLASR